MIPFQITFLDFAESDAIWIAIQKRVEKLEQFYDRIVKCEVTISLPHRHRHAARLYRIQIRIFLPGNDVIITRKPTQNEAYRDAYVAIRDTFNAAERLIQKKVHILRRMTKTHQNDSHPVGKISKLFSHEGYGFIATNDGREFYFNEKSIINKKFSLLKIGQKVRFSEELGEKGPQATSLTAI